MTGRLNRDSLTALVLTAGFLAYGYQATLITLFPGQETEVFSPRTLPYGLAITGALLSSLQLFKCLRNPVASTEKSPRYDWLRTSALLAAMIVYGALFEPLGFAIATWVFLLAGFLILGERRRLLLVLLPALFSLLFWLLMTRGLGLYLAPGTVWS